MATIRRAPVPPPKPPTPKDGSSGALMESEKLPQLKSSENMIDRSKPLPTSLQSDFLPEDVLFSLTQPPAINHILGPPNKFRGLNTSLSKTRAPPANVWNSQRRERFKHLTDNTTCTCGAGKDISFLYDVPKADKKAERPDIMDKSAVRKDALEPQKQILQLPDTLIPEEYHIVKNKGVMGIEYHEDKYSNQVEDHEKHLVVFPSMKPASRYEVVQLKSTMEEMLDRAGVHDTDIEIKGPTQMHNLLELIKKEQNIYNIVFHELIRQASIECVERGELLADLRAKYSNLLNRVPQQIKSLHEEVMAQRALDRRLTEELMRFKSTISILTSELSEVKEHDKKVTIEAQQAQDDLKTALSDAQKNASLLAEYHELYELQRRRLESQVFMLTEEREIWSCASYCLAMKVTEEAQLTTAKRLHVSEKAWAKLAHHFTILLSDKDTDLLTKIQTHVESWRDMVEEFSILLRHREEEMRQQLRLISPSIDRWLQDLRKCLKSKTPRKKKTPKFDYLTKDMRDEVCYQNFKKNFKQVGTKDGQFVRAPSLQDQQNLLEEVRQWEELLGHETEKFGGDMLLNGQEALHKIKGEMDGWTDNAMMVFSRHKGSEGNTHADQIAMNELNEAVESLLTQFNTRITGENGVATNVIHLMNGMETWDLKLTSSISGTTPIHDNEWAGLLLTMEDWLTSIEEAVEYVGSTQREEDRAENLSHTRTRKQGWPLGVEVYEMVRRVQKWVTTATNAIDSEDGKLVEQVTTLHSEMIRWMVQVLLRLAPDKEGNSKEAGEMALLGSTTFYQLHQNAKMLFEQLQIFSNYVVQLAVVCVKLQLQRDQGKVSSTPAAPCNNGIVMANTQLRRDLMEENADHELSDLNRLRTECHDWIKTAKILLSKLMQEPVHTLFPPVKVKDQGEKENNYGIPQEIVDREKLARAERDEAGDNEQAGASTDTIETVDSLDLTPAADKGQPEETPAPAPDKPPADEVPPVEPKEPSAPKEPASGQPSKTSQASQISARSQTSSRELLPEKLEVIGSDENTHLTDLEQRPSQPYVAEMPKPPPSMSGPQASVSGAGVPDPGKAYEALAAVESLQKQLLSTEERAQTAEERAEYAELQLNNSQEKLRELTKKLAELEEANSVMDDKVVTQPSVAKTVTETPAKPATPSTSKPPPTPPSRPASKDDKKRPESQTSKSSKGSRGGKRK